MIAVIMTPRRRATLRLLPLLALAALAVSAVLPAAHRLELGASELARAGTAPEALGRDTLPLAPAHDASQCDVCLTLAGASAAAAPAPPPTEIPVVAIIRNAAPVPRLRSERRDPGAQPRAPPRAFSS